MHVGALLALAGTAYRLPRLAWRHALFCVPEAPGKRNNSCFVIDGAGLSASPERTASPRNRLLAGRRRGTSRLAEGPACRQRRTSQALSGAAVRTGRMVSDAVRGLSPSGRLRGLPARTACVRGQKGGAKLTQDETPLSMAESSPICRPSTCCERRVALRPTPRPAVPLSTGHGTNGPASACGSSGGRHQRLRPVSVRIRPVAIGGPGASAGPRSRQRATQPITDRGRVATPAPSV